MSTTKLPKVGDKVRIKKHENFKPDWHGLECTVLRVYPTHKRIEIEVPTDRPDKQKVVYPDEYDII